jgi:hypothetical protein
VKVNDIEVSRLLGYQFDHSNVVRDRINDFLTFETQRPITNRM